MDMPDSPTFLTSDGRVLYKNTRAILLDVECCQHLWEDLVNNLGLSMARQVFMRFGYAAGYGDARKVRDSVGERKTCHKDWLHSVLQMTSVRGLGYIKIHEARFDLETEEFHVELEAKNTFEAEQHRIKGGVHLAPACNFLSGYLSGFASLFMQIEILFNEVSCTGQGDSHCCFIGKRYRDWPQDIRSVAHTTPYTCEWDKFQKIVTELKESEAKYRDLYNNAPTMYFSIDDNGTIIECNLTCTNMLGYAHEELVGKSIFDFFLHNKSDQFWKTIRENMSVKNMEGTFLRKDGGEMYVYIDATASINQYGTIERVRCAVVDISDRKRLEMKLKDQNRILARMNKTDELTKLYNRRFLMEMMDSEYEKADRYGYPLSVIIIDLDRFKQVNDYFGHQVGDAMLQKVSALLMHNVRQGDIPARFGGEEFVILAPHTNLEGAFDLADKLRSIVEHQGKIEIEKDVIINITASFGVSCYDKKNYLNLNLFLQAADDALLKSKRNGRNRVMVSEADAYS